MCSYWIIDIKFKVVHGMYEYNFCPRHQQPNEDWEVSIWLNQNFLLGKGHASYVVANSGTVLEEQSHLWVEDLVIVGPEVTHASIAWVKTLQFVQAVKTTIDHLWVHLFTLEFVVLWVIILAVMSRKPELNRKALAIVTCRFQEPLMFAFANNGRWHFKYNF